ncbi:ABC transporter substrate-binding protein [Konateibacter massiliensis]|uniref:ABC transporter substrate-binding protein n=1 Tax=Konateibacter massiliensis TaxID=2002841 RepID=UPI000C14A7A2|nr:ABC transporter substrate-binding protein [Konateibacter massiliensis]
MKKKFISTLLVTAMTATMLAGCGSSSTTGTATGETATDTTGQAAATETEQTETADAAATDSIVTEPTELTLIFADGDDGYKTVMNAIVDRFNATYPDITVTIEPGNGGAYSEFLKTKDSVGEFPDIMEMRDTAVYVRAGKIAPLSEDITSLFKTTTEFDGSVYTAPMAGENTDGIFYNKDYFDKNGFTEPTTYDEFLELCQKIKDKGDMSPLVVGGQDIWHMGFWFHKAYSDQVLSQDADFIKHAYEGTKDFSDDTFKATFEELKTIMQYAQDGWASTPDAQIATFMANDMSAMMFSGTHMVAQLKAAAPDMNIGWFPIPSPDGKMRLVGGAGISGLAMSTEAAADSNKKAAAEEFIKFFFESKNYKEYCETMSAIPTTVNDPQISAEPVFVEIMQAVDDADEIGPMWNGRSGENELPTDFRNFTYKTLIEVLQGTRDIDSATTELNKTWQTSMESFNPVTGVGIE